MKKVVVKRKVAANVDILHDETLHPILRQIYANRGINRLDDLNYQLDQLIPFDKLLGISDAVSVLHSVLESKQKILIIGDYDVDGATSTALMVRALRGFGADQVDFLTPNRFEYGYGLTPELVDLSLQYSPDLLITVDNGIASVEGVDYANKKGLKVIITDHHIAGDKLPDASAIVNPNQPTDSFPSKNLAGVGVVLYVILALRAKLREESYFEKHGISEPNLADFLDLAALGTIADVVSLDKNNRIIVDQGLKRIRANRCCPGIAALIRISNREISEISAADLSFSVAPRLNAAGRLDDMSVGVRCLLENDPKKAENYAVLLNQLNEQRREIEKEMRGEALEIVKKYQLNSEATLPVGLCLRHDDWHQGVIGIVAARIKEKLNRPVVVFALAEDGKHLKGSARSIPGVHIRDVLSEIAVQAPAWMTRFGGHAQAAGLTLDARYYDEFCLLFDSVVKKHVVDLNTLEQEIYTDGELASDDLSLGLAELIFKSGPWGHEFVEPLFDGCFRVVDQRLVGGHHLKMTLRKDSQHIDSIAFNVDIERWPNHRAEMIHAVYRLDINKFLGQRKLQLIVEHFEPI